MTFLLIISQLIVAPPNMPLSVATTDDALAMFANPAGLSTNRGFNLYYLYKVRNWKINKNSSFACQLGPLGLSWDPESTFSFGIGLGLKLGDYLSFGARYYRHYLDYWSLGLLLRPSNALSIGVTWPDINYKDWRALTPGIGIRPLGDRLTLVAEASLDTIKKPWFGLCLQPIKGVELQGMIKTDRSLKFGIDISFGQSGIGYTGAKMKNSEDFEHAVYLRLNKDIRPSVVPTQSRYLSFKLSGTVKDIKPGFSFFGLSARRTTYEILDLINRAKEDKKIEGIILTLDSPQLNYAQAIEIRQTLAEFKSEGKKIIVSAAHLSTNSYFIASVADLIVSHPLGEVIIPGMYSQVSLLKGTLAKLGIEAEADRAGKYKNAPEILTADSLSPAYREVLNSVLDNSYDYFLDVTAKARGLSKETMEEKINYGFFTAAAAKKEGLIDTLVYSDQLDSVYEKKFGKIRRISERSYRNQTYQQTNWVEPSDKIAVIYASGSIMGGESGTDFLSGDQTIGANTLSRAIKRTGQDKSVKAIVLRIDSPGGDGFASDLIWREIELAKKKKPVIVSMGPVAASGGYYIACNSDKIFALPATITGSIGAFSLKMVFAGLYDKIGMKNEIIKRGDHADAFSANRKFTDEEHQIMQQWVEDFYHQFVDKVAKGRNKSYDYIDSIGQGRVWTGSQAKELGLVDSLAGLLTAIDYAKNKAKIKKVKLDFQPKLRSFFFGPVMSWLWHRLFIQNFQ